MTIYYSGRRLSFQDAGVTIINESGRFLRVESHRQLIPIQESLERSLGARLEIWLG